ncbi:MAG: hypothetical protein ABIQ41_04120 [Gemmatimonadales bacterium]
MTTFLLVGAGLLLAGILLRHRSANSRVAQARDSRLPTSYDLDNPTHVLLLDSVRDKYSYVLGYDSSRFAACLFKPASMLPFPREDIRTALEALLAFARGERSSTLLDASFRNQQSIDQLEVALLSLDNFLDVPEDQIPVELRDNARLGFGLSSRPDSSDADI